MTNTRSPKTTNPANSVADARTDTPAAVQVQQLNPATLLVDVNVRHDARLDRDFIASIREHGVLVPITAVRTTEGTLRVRFGHRRTLAAIDADLAIVPVVVVADEATDDAAQVERLVTQYAENQHRVGLSTAEQVGVAAQLAAFGISPAQIARKTRMPRPQVERVTDVHQARYHRRGG